MHLTDIRLLGPVSVLPARHEVMFHDGLTVGLHPVAAAGHVHTFLRAVVAEGRTEIIDLRQVSGELHDDLLRLQPRDHPGAVFYTLRGMFHTRRAFLDELDGLALQQHGLVSGLAPQALAA